MKKHNLFLAHQIARFGAVSIQQMELACAGKCKKATIYRMLDDLMSQGLVKRITKGTMAKFLFAAKPELYKLLYDEVQKRNTGLASNNLLHAGAVADTLLTLSRYPFVTGIATEFEMDSSHVAEFCHERTPDAVIQVTKGRDTLAIAVEVERSRRTQERISEVLNKYAQTIRKQMPCDALMVVTGDRSLKQLYESTLAKHYPGIEKQVLIVSTNDLLTLDPKHWGVIQSHPQKSLENMATWFQGTPAFSSMNSLLPLLEASNQDTYVDMRTAHKINEHKQENFNSNINSIQSDDSSFSATASALEAPSGETEI